MTALELAIESAITHEGDAKYANKAYLEFIKANFMIPIEKEENDSEPKVLYFQDNNQTFLPVFSNKTYFDEWAFEIKEKINVLNLSGVNLLKGIGEKTIVSLNLGSKFYKEFNQMELARMRSMILKIFPDQIKGTENAKDTGNNR